MLKPDQLEAYFPDLGRSRRWSRPWRWSTAGTARTPSPQWGLAQPFHLLAHNGEINTLSGNVHWLKARAVADAEPDARRRPGEGPAAAVRGPERLGGPRPGAVQLLVHSGRSLPHALMMLVPEAYEGDRVLDPGAAGLLPVSTAASTEPWDGPASLVFTDGTLIGAMLDRNGLRPSRYVVTHDDLVVLASEAGVLPVPPEQVRYKGRLQPGKLFLRGHSPSGRIIGDDELKESICRPQPYGLWLEQHQLSLDDLPEPAEVPAADPPTLLRPAAGLRIHPGRRRRDPRCRWRRTARSRSRAWAPTSRWPSSADRSQLLPNYFKQLFAQVTNPPIDPIREKVVMNTESLLGARGEPARRDARARPALAAQVADADSTRTWRGSAAARPAGLHGAHDLPILFDRGRGRGRAEAGARSALRRGGRGGATRASRS